MEDNEKAKYDREDILRRRMAELSTRLNGSTTRLADKYIQDLYNHQGEWIEIHDHYDWRNANDILLKIILRRLEIEHPLDVFKHMRGGANPKIMLVRQRKDKLKEEIEKGEKEIILL